MSKGSTGTASEMLALLRDLEWSGRSGIEGEDAACPECGLCQGEIDYNCNSELTPSDEHGHSDKCRLSRIVHGPVSVERQALIAVAHEKADKLHREYQALSAEEKRAEEARFEQYLRAWENKLFNEAVRHSVFTK